MRWLFYFYKNCSIFMPMGYYTVEDLLRKGEDP